MRILSTKSMVIVFSIMLLLAVVNAPEYVYMSLSEDDILEESTYVEINLLRIFLFAISLLFILGIIIWYSSAGKNWRTKIEVDFKRFSNSLPKYTNKKFLLIWAIVLIIIYILLIITIRLSMQFYSTPWFKFISEENGFWETITAINLFFSGILIIFYAWKYRKEFYYSKIFIVPILFGLLFLITACEEVSWGQHWLGYTVNGTFQEINIQGECNLHNMGSYWSNQMMILFFLVYVGVLPLLYHFFLNIKYLLRSLYIPIVPLVFFQYGFIGILFDERSYFQRAWGYPLWRLSEAREVLFSFIILGTAIYALLEIRKNQSKLPKK